MLLDSCNYMAITICFNDIYRDCPAAGRRWKENHFGGSLKAIPVSQGMWGLLPATPDYSKPLYDLRDYFVKKQQGDLMPELWRNFDDCILCDDQPVCRKRKTPGAAIQCGG
jgi:hypothetical protein